MDTLAECAAKPTANPPPETCLLDISTIVLVVMMLSSFVAPTRLYPGEIGGLALLVSWHCQILSKNKFFLLAFQKRLPFYPSALILKQGVLSGCAQRCKGKCKAVWLYLTTGMSGQSKQKLEILSDMRLTCFPRSDQLHFGLGK